MIDSIPAGILAELSEMPDGDGIREAVRGLTWIRVAAQHIRTSRWCEHYWLAILADDGQLYGIEYREGLTENQENEYPWADVEGDFPLPVVPLYAQEKTITVYQTEPVPAPPVPPARPSMNRAGLLKAKLYGEAVATSAAQLVKAEAEHEFTNNGTAASWSLPGGAGTATTHVTQDALVVEDEGAFWAWLREQHPSEVIDVPAVRNPEWLTKAKAQWLEAARAGRAELPGGTKINLGGEFKTLAVVPNGTVKRRLAQGATAMLGAGTLPALDDLWRFATEGTDES